MHVTGLSVVLPGGETLVSNINCTVMPGQVISILGPSGAGKTTLVRALLSPEQLREQGYRVSWTHRQVSPDSALVPQRGALLDHLDVGENIALAQAGSGRAREVEPWLSAVELDPGLARQRRPVAALSGGQAQRVAVARTLAAGRQLLVLDEPSVGLDPLGVRRLAKLLLRQARQQQVGVLLITHDLTLAGGASDMVVFLDPARKSVYSVSSHWPGPVELDPSDRRQWRLAQLETAVEQLLSVERPPPPGARRSKGWSLGLLAPFGVLGGALVHALRPRLMGESLYVLVRLTIQALVKPLLFFGIVGALLGLTVPFVMVNVSNALSPKAILGIVGGSYILSLAPPISAIVFSATSGSAVNAWLGGQRLHGQVVALEGLGISPARYLWSPAWFALAGSYAATAVVFILAMVAGGLALFLLYEVPDPLWKLVSNFVDPAPGQLIPLLRMLALFLMYTLAIPSIVVAKGSEPKTSSDEVTSAMTSSVMRSTLFIVGMELMTTVLQYVAKVRS